MEPTTNSGTPRPRDTGLTESCAHGVVEPIPTKPAGVIVVVAVPPKYEVPKTESRVVLAPPFSVAKLATERVLDRVEAPVIVAVPVAVKLARDRLPEKRESPWTESLDAGEVVPIPTLPELVTVKSVVEALFTTSRALVARVVSRPQTVRPAYGVEVPIPTFVDLAFATKSGVALLRKTDIVDAPLFATTKSAFPSPLKSPAAMPRGVVPVV